MQAVVGWSMLLPYAYAIMQKMAQHTIELLRLQVAPLGVAVCEHQLHECIDAAGGASTGQPSSSDELHSLYGRHAWRSPRQRGLEDGQC